MSQDPDVVWARPPGRPSAYDWTSIAETLRSKPGEWARIFSGGRVSVANSVRQGSVLVLHPDLGFEVRTTNNVPGQGPERTCSLYMRWNPDKVVQSEPPDSVDSGEPDG